MFSLKSRSAAAALAAGLAISLAACGGSEDTETPDATESAASTEPIAAIDSLTGKQTAVTLDPSFLEGITGLGLTPATLGGATLDAATGVVAFPITGGNVEYYDPNGTVQPYVTGLINHDGSGLSLSAGATTVMLEDFEVDPDESVLYGKVTVNGRGLRRARRPVLPRRQHPEPAGRGHRGRHRRPRGHHRQPHQDRR
jgi:hypothetical protein